MASSEKKQLEDAFKSSLKDLGFRKRGGTWHRHTDDVIHVVNIQSSQWSKTFYVNLGVYIRTIGSKEHLPLHKCHVRTRLSDLVPDVRHLNSLLDLDEAILTPDAANELTALLLAHGIPWLERCSTRQGLVAALGESHPPAILRSVKEHFDLGGV